MNILKRLFGKKTETQGDVKPEEVTESKTNPKPEADTVEKASNPPTLKQDRKPLKQKENELAEERKPSDQPNPDKRSIRVFVSSTFRDMIEDRNQLMTHCWPQLRKFCAERHVELTEVDLRWGIAEEQSTRKETLKLCLDEIRACRPFFIGLLGERYGWIPGDDAFTADLKEEQPWLNILHGKSVTELEILHGVLNNPEMAGRAFFYFRTPEYAQKHGVDFLPENEDSAQKQTELKELIRATCAEKNIPLHETYPDPETMAALVLEQLKDAIEVQFPKESIPDPLYKEASDHDAFAEIRRRTYIGRPDYFEALDRHISSEGTPLVLIGESGSGKSSLLANWIEHWRKAHPKDFIFQHYIGGTPDSAVHWKLMTRLMAEIKRWTDDPDEIPRTNDDILRDFPLWLSKARIRAEHIGVKFIVVLDALNQLEDIDHGRILGWLPQHLFTGALKLIVSTLPGDTMEVLGKRKWSTLQIQPLTTYERKRIIIEYLKRFSKKLDDARIDRLANSKATANPLYLKILLDELRVTGTHDKLDERLDDYLSASDIPALLGKVLARYQRDYEHNRKGLVKDVLGLIWTARRGLTEAELLELLKPDDLPQLPLATWAPLRAALEEGLVDRGGILNFAHDFLHLAVETAFLPDMDTKDDFRIKLADYFEVQPITARSCDELPWLLWQVELLERLRNCLLDIDRFIEISERDVEELRGYWVGLGEIKSMGKFYLDSFNVWIERAEINQEHVIQTSSELDRFLFMSGLTASSEQLLRFSLAIVEQFFGKDDPNVAIILGNLMHILQQTNRFEEAELLIRRALRIHENCFGKNDHLVAIDLNNLALLFRATNRVREAEPLLRRALEIDERNFGENHPKVARSLNNLAILLQTNNHLNEAEILYRRALKIDEESNGKNHPKVANILNNLASLLYVTNNYGQAEPLIRRALKIDEESFGKDHINVAMDLNILAHLLKTTNRLGEAEPLMRRHVEIFMNFTHANGHQHEHLQPAIDNYIKLLQDLGWNGERIDLQMRKITLDIKNGCPANDPLDVTTDVCNHIPLSQEDNPLGETEPLDSTTLEIKEESLGKEHPEVGTDLDNQDFLIHNTNNFKEKELLMRKAIEIKERSMGKDHPEVAFVLNNLAQLLKGTNRLDEAEKLMIRALRIDEASLGEDHPDVARDLNNLAQLLQATNRLDEAKPLMIRALKINVQSLGKDHPDVGRDLNNLAGLLQASNHFDEAEPIFRTALQIFEKNFGKDHPNVAAALNNLAGSLQATNRLDEAEPLIRRALKIDVESFGKDHPNVAIDLHNLATLLQANNRHGEAEPLSRKHVEIFLHFTRTTGHQHPFLQAAFNNYASLLQAMGWGEEQITDQLRKIAPELFE